MADAAESKPQPKRRPTRTFKDGRRPESMTSDAGDEETPKPKPRPKPRPLSTESPDRPVVKPRPASTLSEEADPESSTEPIPELPARSRATLPKKPPPTPPPEDGEAPVESADADKPADEAAEEPAPPVPSRSQPAKKAPAPDPVEEASPAADAEPNPVPLPPRSKPAESAAEPVSEPANPVPLPPRSKVADPTPKPAAPAPTEPEATNPVPLPPRTKAAEPAAEVNPMPLPPKKGAKAPAPEPSEDAPSLPARKAPMPLPEDEAVKVVEGATKDSSSSDAPPSSSKPMDIPKGRKASRHCSKTKPSKEAPPPPPGAATSPPTAGISLQKAPVEEAEDTAAKSDAPAEPAAKETADDKPEAKETKTSSDKPDNGDSSDDEEYFPLEPPKERGKVLILAGKTPEKPMPYQDNTENDGKVIDALLAESPAPPQDLEPQGRVKTQKKRSSLMNLFASKKTKKNDTLLLGREEILKSVNPNARKIGTAVSNKVTKAKDYTHLSLANGEAVDIVQLDGGPVGKWIARNSIGDLGFVDCSDVIMDPGDLKNLMSTIPPPKKAETSAEGIPLNLRGAVGIDAMPTSKASSELPAKPKETVQHNYEDVVIGEEDAKPKIVQEDYADMSLKGGVLTPTPTAAVTPEEDVEQTYEVLDGVNNPPPQQQPVAEETYEVMNELNYEAMDGNDLYENPDEVADGYEQVSEAEDEEVGGDYEVLSNVNTPDHIEQRPVSQVVQEEMYVAMDEPGPDQTYDVPRDIACVEIGSKK